MDEIKASIKTDVIKIDSDLEGNTSLDLIIDEVVDRVLIYTNREQLVRQYEEDVEDYPITDKTDTDEDYYEYWKHYRAYPIPTQLYSSIARVVVNLINTYDAEFDSREVKSIRDLDQSITFADEIQSYLASKDDVEILMSMKSLLDKFRIPTVVEHTYWNETEYF
jgi:hypothetical protein